MSLPCQCGHWFFMMCCSCGGHVTSRHRSGLYTEDTKAELLEGIKQQRLHFQTLLDKVGAHLGILSAVFHVVLTPWAVGVFARPSMPSCKPVVNGACHTRQPLLPLSSFCTRLVSVPQVYFLFFCFRSKHAGLDIACVSCYQEEPVFHVPARLLDLLIDVDEFLTAWRHRHALMVHRYVVLRSIGQCMSPSVSSLTPILSRVALREPQDAGCQDRHWWIQRLPLLAGHSRCA